MPNGVSDLTVNLPEISTAVDDSMPHRPPKLRMIALALAISELLHQRLLHLTSMAGLDALLFGICEGDATHLRFGDSHCRALI